MKRHLRLSCVLSLASALMVGQSVFASGFEKGIMFGGQTSGVAGIATSYTEGSQALYFNPAGLVSTKADAKDLSLNLSPTMTNYKEAVNATGEQQTSNHTLLPFSLMYGQTLGDRWGYGVGLYTSGGGYGDFTSSGNTESKLDLAIYEASVGVGYRVADNLKIGASYRVAMAQGNLAVSTNNGQVSEQLTGLKGTSAAGWKVGAQYKIWDRWDIGLTYRSEVDFKAKGSISASSILGTQNLGDVTVGTALPAAWTLGSSWYLNDTWRMFAEYSYIQYSADTNLAINTASGGSPLQLSFKDEHAGRLAAEYKGWSWPVRFGYAFTSQVTDSGHALPGLTPPGTANTLTLGTGQAFTFGGQAIRIDGGFEYTWINGNSTAANNSVDYSTGSNSLTEMALHLGAQYMF